MKPNRFELAVLVVLASLVVYQNFVPPLIGLADSGDFARFFAQAGLTYSKPNWEDRYFYFFNVKYRVVERTAEVEPYRSSSSLLIRAARWLSIKAGENDYFDIRVLAALRAIAFLLAMWMILRGARSLSFAMRAVLSGCLVLIFTDVGYIAYFNSLYSEATGLCFLAAAIGSALILMNGSSSSILPLAVYFGAQAIVVTSKPQYAPLAPIFALFGIYLSRRKASTRLFGVSIVLSLALCGLAAWYYSETPKSLRMQVAYLGIFMDLLPNSTTPEEDLAEIGLNPAYASFSGTSPYQDDTPFSIPELRADFTTKITSHSLPWFYASHPKRLYGLCQRCVRHVFDDRIARLGYYEAEAGKPPQTQGTGIWSSIRENLFPRSLLFVGLFIATGIPAFVLALRVTSESMRSLCAVYLLFVSVALVQFFVAFLSQGEMDLEKHLFMFNLAFDACIIMVVLGVAHLLQRVVRRARPQT